MQKGFENIALVLILSVAWLWQGFELCLKLCHGCKLFLALTTTFKISTVGPKNMVYIHTDTFYRL
jgi:hypothetical protein